MTNDDLREIETKYPGLFTTPNMGINRDAIPGDGPVIFTNLLFCCDFPGVFQMTPDGKKMVATCPECDKIWVHDVPVPESEEDREEERKRWKERYGDDLDDYNRPSKEIDWTNALIIGNSF